MSAGITNRVLTNSTNLSTLTQVQQTQLASPSYRVGRRLISLARSRRILELESDKRAYICHSARPRHRAMETHHLDPVPVRVQDERDVPHLAVREALLERHAESLEARARFLDVGHGDGDVPEPPRLGVARVVWRRFQRLRAVVVGKFEDA